MVKIDALYVYCVCVSGYVYVDLHSDEEVEKALKKNKDYISEKITCPIYCIIVDTEVYVITATYLLPVIVRRALH